MTLAVGLLDALDRMARRPRLLVALDFDGVLAPIVAVPGDARALPQAAEALRGLAGLPGLNVALVSGRALDDLRTVAQPPPGVLLGGSHGAESDAPALAGPPPTAAQRDLLARLVAELQRVAAAHPGTHVEVKPAGVALHTRRAARGPAAAAVAAVAGGPGAGPGVHLRHGKEVVELSVVPATKGAFLTRLRAGLGLPAGSGGVLYVGDDVTDEDAFAVLDDDSGDLTVKVGPGETRARHRLAGPDEVAVLLVRLAGARSGAAAAGSSGGPAAAGDPGPPAGRWRQRTV